MFKKLLIAASLLAAASAPAWSQAGQFPSGWIHGNAGASAGQGSPSSVTSIFDRALGSTRGALIERGAGGWAQLGPGTTGKPFVSAGAGADPSYATLGIVGGGTNCAAASGTCLDNITGFASTGVIQRTGAGAYSLTTPAALTSANDTNVTITLGGTPASALLAASSITMGWAGTLSVARGGTGAASQSAAAIAIFPTPTRAGDIVFWNGAAWVTLAGNNSGTNVLSENASGVPSWAAPGAGTLQTLTAGTGINFSSGATCTTTCTVNLTTPVAAANGGAGTITGALKGNGAGVVSQAATSDLSDVVAPTTWTPSDQSGAALTFTSVTALYTRIGKHVVAQFILTFPSTANGATTAIGGLPVASSSSGAAFSAGICKSNLASNFIIGASMAANTSVINLNTINGNITNSVISTDTISCTISYISN